MKNILIKYSFLSTEVKFKFQAGARLGVDYLTQWKSPSNTVILDVVLRPVRVHNLQYVSCCAHVDHVDV